jgi:acyl-CoA dehydrogenase
MAGLCDPSPEVAEIIAGLRAFIQSEVVERQARANGALSEPVQVYGEDGRYRPHVLEAIHDVRTASAEAGYYTMFVPTALGGGGLDHLTLYHVWEDVFHTFGPEYWLNVHVVAHWVRGPSAVLEHVTPAVRERILPELMSGRASICFGMSEPDAGSDARQMKTAAVADGDGWRISGSKTWITNGPYADYALVFAVTDAEAARRSGAGISAFLVPTDTPGFSADPNIRMWGSVSTEEATLYLDEVHVGSEMLVGELGHGFDTALAGASTGRLYNSARVIGLARWALERALAYAQERKAFGTTLASHQGVMFPLAQAASEIRAAHLLGVDTAMLLDAGARAVKELSMAKAFSTDVAVRAIDAAIQAHGAIGFTNELGLVEAWHAVRKARVADGTSEILLRTIANRLLKGDLSL